MAVATIASRATGFGRIAAFSAVLGLGGLRQAFDVANVLPNVVYELLLGGILSATLVPLLVAARARGAQAALAYAQRLLTLVLIGLLLVSGVAVLVAPWLVRLYTRSHDPSEVALTVAWARWFLPQIFFYGLAATIGAVLNAQARFGAAMWAPVLNNVVVITTLAAFLFVPGPARPGLGSLSQAQFLTLAIGTTLGVVAMAAVLLPTLRASGFRWRLRLDVRGMGLRAMGRMAAWTLLYVAATQVGVWVQTRLATSAQVPPGSAKILPTYTSASTVWQLPHAIIAVSLITALLPRTSAHAAGGDWQRLRADLDRGVRVCVLALVPLAVVFAVCGRDIAIVLFAHGATSVTQARQVGWVLALLAMGLVPFSAYQLQARAFYAQRDTRTPALVQCTVSAVLIGVQTALAALLPATGRGYALAGGHACAYVVGVVVSAVALRWRIARAAASTAVSTSSTPSPESVPASGGRVDGALLVRLLPATAACAGAVVAVSLLLGEPGAGWSASLLRGGAAGAAGLFVYAVVLWLLGVAEVRALRWTAPR